MERKQKFFTVRSCLNEKDSKNTESNYRPVNMLLTISKIYEKCIFSQISNCFEKILSRYQFGFGKGHSTQQCLLVMIEKWRQSLGKGGHYGAPLTDLSKAFDCLSHDLLIAKLHAHGFDIPALRLPHNYLTTKKHRVKIDSTFSSWEEILFDVPQGSFLGSLLFNIFLCDLFLLINDIDIASYADDNTPYTVHKSPEKVIKVLKDTSVDLLPWFRNNGTKANADKCHLLVNSKEKVCTKIGSYNIESSEQQKLLGVLIDNKLTFEKHINNLCTKASQKLNALCRVSSFMSTNKKRLVMKTFISSQFSYCPLIWMNHSRTLNNKINRIHERSLRVVHNDKATFKELLDKSKL